MTFVVNPYVFANPNAALDKAAVAQAFPGSSFTTTSATYVNLLNGSGGANIEVPLSKGAGTQILLSVGIECSVSAAQAVTLGVSDGTTDYDIVVNAFTPTGQIEGFSGERLISGLGTATYTFTLRVRIAGGATLTFGTTGSAYIRAWEVT